MNKIGKLKELYNELAEILDKYGKTYHDYFLINNRLSNIQGYLDKVEVKNSNISDIIKDLKQVHDRFYSPRGGLSDFVITIDDKIKEEKLNQRLENIQDEIDKILRSV